MLASKRRTLKTLDEMARNGPWMLFSGMAATVAGLAIVLTHNVWIGDTPTPVVTLVGWGALLKGLSLLLVSSDIIARAYRSMGFQRYFHL